jgi:hypothetical protein
MTLRAPTNRCNAALTRAEKLLPKGGYGHFLDPI